MLWHNTPDDEHPPGQRDRGDGPDLAVGGRGRPGRRLGRDGVHADLGRLGRLRRPRQDPRARVHARQRATRPRPACASPDVRRRGQARHRQPLVLAREHPEDRDAAARPARARRAAGRRRPRAGGPGRPRAPTESPAPRLRHPDRSPPGSRARRSRRTPPRRPARRARRRSETIILRDGSTLPPPNDAPLPKQPNPPTR